MKASELYGLIEKTSTSIAYLTFNNGEGTVTVHRTGHSDAVVTLEDGGVQTLKQKALEHAIAYDAIGAPVDKMSLLREFAPFLLAG